MFVVCHPLRRSRVCVALSVCIYKRLLDKNVFNFIFLSFYVILSSVLFMSGCYLPVSIFCSCTSSFVCFLCVLNSSVFLPLVCHSFSSSVHFRLLSVCMSACEHIFSVYLLIYLSLFLTVW